MSWSIQQSGDRSDMLNDGALVALICLLEDEVARTPDGFAALRVVIEGWQVGIAKSGPGTIDLRLDETLPTRTERTELAALLQVVEQSLAGSPTISGASLNRRVRDGSTFHEEYPASHVVEAMNQLRKLLEL